MVVAWLLTLLLSQVGYAEGPFEGIWESNFGLIDLTQDAARLYGTYASFGGGAIDGTIEGETFHFTWRDPVNGEGWGTFTITPDGQRLEGVWGFGLDRQPRGRWNASRLQQPKTFGTPSYWQVTGTNRAPVGTLTGLAELYVHGPRVTGILSGHSTSTVQDKDTRQHMFQYLDGKVEGPHFQLQWRNPYDNSYGTMTLTRHEDRLKGRWQTHDHSSSGELTLVENVQATRPESLQDQVQYQRRQQRAKRLLHEGGEHLRAARYDEAQQRFEEAATLFQALGDTTLMGYALLFQGTAYVQVGNYEQARQQYARVLRLEPRVDPELLKTAERNLALMNQIFLNLPSSLTTQDGRATPPSGADVSLHDLPGEALKLLAQGAMAPALDLLEAHALKLHRDGRGHAGDAMRHATLLRYAADVRLRLGHYDASIQHLKAALAIWRLLEAPPHIAGTLTALGLVYQLQGDEATAKDYFTQALTLQQSTQDPDIWRTYYWMARLLENSRHSPDAEPFYDHALANIERLRETLRTDETKIGFFEYTIEPYTDFVAFLMSRDPTDMARRKALHITERARARALLDTLAGSELQSGTASITETFGELPSFGQAQALRYDEIAQLAQDHKVVYLSYFVTRGATYAWVVLPSGKMATFALPISRQDLQKQVHTYREQLRKGLYQKEGRRLFELLIQPLMPTLQDLPTGAPVTILPHDALNLVPFTALLDGDTFLGVRFTLTVAPSFSFARLLPAFVSEEKDQLLAIGDPAGADVYKSRELVAAVSALFDPYAKQLLGAAATKAQILAQMPAYQVILFSTHGQPRATTGTVPTANQNEFYLLLANQQELTAQDIRSLKLDAVKLAALVACDTHVGMIRGGDELMSLSRAFLVSGVDYVLISLWKADASRATLLMQDFFSRLHTGTSPARALQQAQDRYLNEVKGTQWTQPRYWAPWVLIGRNG